MIIEGLIEWGLETQAMEISDAAEKLAVKLWDAWPNEVISCICRKSNITLFGEDS